MRRDGGTFADKSKRSSAVTAADGVPLSERTICRSWATWRASGVTSAPGGTARLAPKGEVVLAEVGVPFVLETTGLQVQVTVTDLQYGEGQTPPRSFFRQLTLGLVAMAKPAE